MEGAGFIRSHSEKVELKNNIFAEDDAQEDGGDDPQAQATGQAASPPGEEIEDGVENYIFEDEHGNQINIADLENFKGNLDDPEAVELALA